LFGLGGPRRAYERLFMKKDVKLVPGRSVITSPGGPQNELYNNPKILISTIQIACIE
jgi:hypothetical protein